MPLKEDIQVYFEREVLPLSPMRGLMRKGRLEGSLFQSHFGPAQRRQMQLLKKFFCLNVKPKVCWLICLESSNDGTPAPSSSSRRFLLVEQVNSVDIASRVSRFLAK